MNEGAHETIRGEEWQFLMECSADEADVLKKTAPDTLDILVEPQPGQEGKYYVFYRKVTPCVHTKERPKTRLSHHYIIPKESWPADPGSRALLMKCEAMLQRIGGLGEASAFLSPLGNKSELVDIEQRVQRALEPFMRTRVGEGRMIVRREVLCDVLPSPYRAMFGAELASAYGVLGELRPENLDYPPESDRLYGEVLKDIEKDSIHIVGATAFLRMANLEYIRAILKAENNLANGEDGRTAEVRFKLQRAQGLSASASEFAQEHEPLRAYTLLVNAKCHAALGDDMRLAAAIDDLQQSLDSLGEDRNRLIQASLDSLRQDAQKEGAKAGFIPGVPANVMRSVNNLLGRNTGGLVSATYEVPGRFPRLL